MIDRVLSAEEFYDQLSELPESGRWCELVAGTVVDLEPPPTAHGAVVLNVAKALGDYCTRKQKGYACFDVRLITRRRPDTVRLPAITYYAGGPAFAEVDASLSRRAPELIVEVASTQTRRRRIPEKILEYRAFGTGHIWVLDVEQGVVEIYPSGRQVQVLEKEAMLRGAGVLAGFRSKVAALLHVPDW